MEITLGDIVFGGSSAGGGGGRYDNSMGNGGFGYQGIVYMRIPEDQAA